MQAISTIQKEKDSLWKGATQDHCIIKSAELGAYIPDKYILQFNKTTAARQRNHPEGYKHQLHEND